MSEVFSVDEVRDLPAIQFRSANVVYDPDPDPTATLVLPDNTTQSLTLTKQGSGTTTRFLVADFSHDDAAQLEVRYITTDTNADIAEFTEYITIRAVDDSDFAPVLDAISDLETEITANGVNILSPYDSTTSSLTLIRGDSYENADSRAIDWTSEEWTDYDLDGAAIVFKAQSKYSGVIFEKAMSYIDAETVRLELTTAETSDFAAATNVYTFDVSATLESGHVITLVRGRLTVLEDVV